MSVMNGGTALKPGRKDGNFSGSAGSAGISITLRTAHLPFLPPSSRYHIQIEAERSLSETTTPANHRFFGDRGRAAARASSVAPHLAPVPADDVACPGPR